MSKVIPGRRTADVAAALGPDADSFVVFLIGMRINKWWKPQEWIPIARSMRPMVKELRAHPELGLLGVEQFIGSTTTLVQYWRSFDDLERFANDPDDLHLPAWRRFGKQLARSDAVGFYHETYQVKLDAYEVVYVNLPDYGLAKATTNVPVANRGDTARARIGRSQQATVTAE